MSNFGFIKNSFNNILSESIRKEGGSGKPLFKRYVRLLKENEVLKTQFLVYKNIEDTIEENETAAIEIVKENIALMDKFSKKQIQEANQKLIDIYPKMLVESESFPYDEKLKKLHEDISFLILTKKNPTTVKAIIETINSVVGYIKNNQPKVIQEGMGILPNSIYFKLLSENFNEKYKDLSESHKAVVKILIESDEVGKEEFFNESVKNCLMLVNTKLKEVDSTTKESLLNAKEVLLEKKYDRDNFIKDISKIIQLTEDLE